jgi:hypothetical protein
MPLHECTVGGILGTTLADRRPALLECTVVT